MATTGWRLGGNAAQIDTSPAPQMTFSGGTALANVLAENDNVISATTTTKNAEGIVELTNFGFDSLIPSGSTIQQVNFRHRGDRSTGASAHDAYLRRSGTDGSTSANNNTSLTTVTVENAARPGGGSWARADLLNGTLAARVRSLQPNNTTSRTYRWAYLQIEVLYTAPPAITSVTPDTFADEDTGIAIVGTDFGSVKGTGKLELASSSDYATATKVEQTTTAWGDTGITFTAVQGALSLGTVYAFVTTDDGRRSAGFAVTLAAAVPDPTLTLALYDGATEIDEQDPITADSETLQWTDWITIDRDLVTDWGNLRVRLTNDGEVDVVEIELRAPAAEAGVNVEGTASLTGQPATHAATGTIRVSGTADLTAEPATHQATAVARVTGTGSVTGQPASLDATGAVRVTGTAALTGQAATHDATGTLTVRGTADLAGQPAQHAASGGQPEAITATGDLVGQPAQIAAQGALTVRGTADLTGQPAALDASGTLTVRGTGALAGEPAAHAATGSPRVSGTADLAGQPASIEGTAVARVVGTADLVGQPAQHTANGGQPEAIEGTGALTAQPAQHVASGTVRVVGTSALTGEPASLSATGAARVTGSADLAGEPATHSATATARVIGTADLTGQPATHNADGTITVPPENITATGDLTAQPAQQQATGAVRVVGTAALSGQAAQITSSGAVRVSGSVAVQGRPAQQQATGTLRLSGTSSVTARAATLTSTGHVRVTGTAAVTAVPATVAGVGQLVLPVGVGYLVGQPAQFSALGHVDVVHIVGTGAFVAQPATVTALGSVTYQAALADYAVVVRPDPTWCVVDRDRQTITVPPDTKAIHP